jgi:hypothetical protein
MQGPGATMPPGWTDAVLDSAAKDHAGPPEAMAPGLYLEILLAVAQLRSPSSALLLTLLSLSLSLALLLLVDRVAFCCLLPCRSFCRLVAVLSFLFLYCHFRVHCDGPSRHSLLLALLQEEGMPHPSLLPTFD